MRGGLHRLLSRASSARAVLALHAAHEPLAPIHLATCWNRLGRATGSELAHLRRGGGKRLEPLRRSTHKSLRRLDAKGLATLAHALGRLRLCGGSETTQPWSELWEGLEEAALRCAARQAFTPQGLSNTAWSHAKAGRRAPALFDALAREAERQADGFNSRDHAITAWAFASAAHAAPSLFDAIAARAGAAPLLGQCSEQSLSNLAWAFATAGHEASELLDAIAGQAAPRLPSFSGQALANTAWAFATASHAAPALFSGIEAEVVARLRAEGGVAPEAAFKPQELSNLAWAFATAGHEAPELLDAIAGEAAPRVGEFSSQGLSMTAWAYAASGRLAPALFDSIAGELAPRVGEFSPQGLSNAAWAFATANHTAPSLLDAIAAQAVARHAELDARCLTATAWSLAVLDMGGNGERGTGGAARFARRFGGWLDSRAAELSHQSLCQLHQWRLWREEERRRSDGLPSAPLLAQAAAAFGATRTRQSEIQSSVGEALAALDTWPEEEVRLPCGYTLDWLVQWRGVSLGVEVDGPRHFLGKRPSGATALKRRQVRAFGTPLVSIPYWEWDGLRDGGARVAFLRRALEREATSKGAEGGSGARGLDGRTSSAASG